MTIAIYRAIKASIAAALMLVSAAPAIACNSELLTVLDWQLIKNEQSRLFPNLISAEVKYLGSRPYRMIHAGVILSDALGRSVGQVNLSRDQTVFPSETVIADEYVAADKRISTINRDDIVYRTCVWSIIYDDGTKEDF